MFRALRVSSLFGSFVFALCVQHVGADDWATAVVSPQQITSSAQKTTVTLSQVDTASVPRQVILQRDWRAEVPNSAWSSSKTVWTALVPIGVSPSLFVRQIYTRAQQGITLGNEGVSGDFRYRFCDAANAAVCTPYSDIQTIAQPETAEPATVDFSATGDYTVSWPVVGTGKQLYRLQEAHRPLLGNTSSWSAWGDVYQGTATYASVQGREDGQYRYRVCVLQGGAGWSCDMTYTGWNVDRSLLSTMASYLGLMRASTELSVDGNYTLNWWDGSLFGTPAVFYAQELNAVGGWSDLVGSSPLSIANKADGVYYYRLVTTPGAQGDDEGFAYARVAVSRDLPLGVPLLKMPSRVVAGNSVNLAWERVVADDGSALYAVERRVFRLSLGDWSSWESTATVDGTSLDLPSAADQDGVVYQYRLRACNHRGCSAYSQAQTLHPRPPAAAPTIAMQGANAWMLSWAAVPGVAAYFVDEYFNGGWVANYYIDPSASPSMTFTAKPEGHYRYEVRSAYLYLGESSDVGVVEVNGGATQKPGAPLSPALQKVGNMLHLSWQAAADGVPVGYYNVLGLEGQEWRSIQEGITTLGYDAFITNAGGSYHFKVQACNHNGCGPASAEASLTIAANGSVIYGDRNLVTSQQSEAVQADPTPQWSGSQTNAIPQQVLFGLLGTELNSFFAGQSTSSDTLGSVPGSFAVDDSGAATYNIPLVIAPGTAGVKPSLALTYNSQDGSGVVGMGWNLQGPSMIVRCPASQTLDDATGVIGWNQNDRFCMDGQRLVLDPTVVGQTYGAEGTVYRAVMDGDFKVTQGPAVNGMPQYFIVERKDGSKAWYGVASAGGYRNETGSSENDALMRGRAADGSYRDDRVFGWAMKRFQDSVGNPIIYHYQSDEKGQRLVSIGYAFAGGDTPSELIELVYEDRPDPQYGLVAGYRTGNGKRLARVDLHGAGRPATAHQYKLSYLDETASPGISRLASVEECRNNACLAPTTFDWAVGLPAQFPATGITFSSPYHANSFSRFEPILVDTDLDGRLELYWSEAEASTSYGFEGDVWVSTVTASPSPTTEGVYVTQSSLTHHFDGCTSDDCVAAMTAWLTGPFKETLDILGDGKPRVLAGYPIGTGGTPTSGTRIWQYCDVNKGCPTTVKAEDSSAGLQVDGKRSFANFDQDGMVDSIRSNGTSLSVRSMIKGLGENRFASAQDYQVVLSSLSTPVTAAAVASGLSSTATVVESSFALRNNSASLFDVDQDGHNDMIAEFNIKLSNGTTVYPFVGVFRFDTLSNTFHLSHAVRLSSAGSTGPSGDFNGDGLPDLIEKTRVDSTDQWQLFLGVGEGRFGQGIAIADVPSAVTSLYPWDGDGDTRVEVLAHVGSLSKLVELRWDGSTLSKTGWERSGVASTTWVNVSDVNGDGKPDLVLMPDGANPSIYLNQNLRAPVNLITGINTGFGNTRQLSYSPLTDKEVYTKLTTFTTGTSWLLTHSTGYTEPAKNIIIAPTYVVASERSSVTAASETPLNVRSGVQRELRYRYAGLQTAVGGGSLGFRNISVIDVQTGLETVTTHNQDYPFVGRTSSVVQRLRKSDAPDGVVTLSEKSTSWALTCEVNCAPPYQSYVPYTSERQYAYREDGSQGDSLSYIATTQQVDSEANVTRIETKQYDNAPSEGGLLLASQLTENTYSAAGFSSSESAFLARLSASKVTHTRGASSAARCSSFEYYASGPERGLLKSESVLPCNGSTWNHGELVASTTNSYDAFGNRASVSHTGAVNLDAAGTGWDSQTRTTSRQYHQGRYLLSETSSGGGASLTPSTVLANDLHPDLGLPKVVTDINGVDTKVVYGAFGAKRYEYRLGSWKAQATVTAASLGKCPAHAVLAEVAAAADGSELFSCLDAQARVVRKAEKGLRSEGGALTAHWVFVDTEYDALGRARHVSEPYFEGDRPVWNSYHYDPIGRVVAMEQADGGRDSIRYQVAANDPAWGALSQVTAINDKGQQHHEFRNALGQLVKVRDHDGAEVRYAFNATGDITTTTTAKGSESVVVSLSYDQLGHKIAMQDPDKGSWQYRYNAFGELVREQDGKGQVTRTSYDSLGRKALVTSYDNTTAEQADEIREGSLYSYVAEPTVETLPSGTITRRGIGQLEFVQHGARGVNDDWQIRAQINIYDQYGRVVGQGIQINESASGISALDQVLLTDRLFTTTTIYDALGRVKRSYDASGGGRGVAYTYGEDGSQQSVTDLTTGAIFQQVADYDARGQITQMYRAGGAIEQQFQYNQGSGLLEQQTTIADGRDVQKLIYARDFVGNITTRFDQSALPGDGYTQRNLMESFGYDSLNRLQSSTVQGQASQGLTYDWKGNILSKTGVGDYLYGTACGTSPLKGVVAGPHAVCQTGSGTAAVKYYYDVLGNMIEDSTGRTIDYTVNEKPWKISQGTNTTYYRYAFGDNRWKRVDVNGSDITTTYTIGDLELIQKPYGSREMKRHIGDAVVSMPVENFVDVDLKATGPAYTRYLLTDDLGSLHTVLDERGKVVQSASFDAWGQRRDANAWTSSMLPEAQVSALRDITSRGFTGHEMMDDLGLVHMNGRIYDARIARFVMADPQIDGVADVQGYNRYSYVHNNPLNAIDPSGYGGLSGLVDDLLDFGSDLLAWGYEAIRIVEDIPKNIRRAVIRAAVKIFGPEVVNIGANIGITYLSAFCGPAASACAAAMSAAWSYEYSRAMGVPPGQALRGAVVAGLSSYVSNNGQKIGGVGPSAENIAAGYAKSFSNGAILSLKAGVIQGGVHGVASSIKGGSFQDGFVTGFTSGVTTGLFGSEGVVTSGGMPGINSIAQKALVQSVVGGTISEVTGGKFANGARAGAFAMVADAVKGSSNYKQFLTAYGANYADLFSELSGGVVDGLVKYNQCRKTCSATDVISNSMLDSGVSYYKNTLTEDPYLKPLVSVGLDLAVEHGRADKTNEKIGIRYTKAFGKANVDKLKPLLGVEGDKDDGHPWLLD